MKHAAEAANTGALLVVEAQRGTLVASGPDRGSWLNGIITCDAEKVAPGNGALGLALTKTGKILSELWLVADDARTYLSTVAGKSAALHQHFDRLLVMEDAEILERSREYRWLALHGPRAADWAERWAAEHAGAFGRIDWTGLGGAALVVPADRLDAITASVTSSDPVWLASEEEWEALRIERGYPRFDVDYGGDDNPHEAALDQLAVCWTKGCYLGQEVVCMQGMRGRVKRHLASLLIDTDVVPEVGAAVIDADGGEVGSVTSAAPSRTSSGVVAFARLAGAASDDAPTLSVAGARARIVERPDPA
jgi:hypothetical protein